MSSPVSLLGRALSRRRADERRSLLHDARLHTTGVLELTSPDFADGETMPVETTGYAAEQSPALS